MKLILAGVFAGVLGTVFMDLLNALFARLGLISRIEVGTIGRMAGGWARGRFRYRHPREMAEVANEKLLGLFTHYAIGVGLALPYVLGWGLVMGNPAPPGWAPVYGVITTFASWFLVYPSMGFGALGLRSPDGSRASISSLANHLFYGLGMAAAIALI